MKKILSFIILLYIQIALPFISFAGNPPDFNNSSISVSSSGSNQVPADGHSTYTLTITLKDSGGNLLTGDSVSLSASNDGSAIFSPSSTTLNASGQAIFTIASTNAQTDNINIVDTTTNTTLTNCGQVTFIAVPITSTPIPSPTSASSCNNTPPGGTPTLVSALSSDPDKITLTWTDAPDPVSYYLLSYGTKAGNYIYGNPNVGSQGTTSYTVGGLTKGTTYYFAIKAVNGCNPGNFSNELKAEAGSTLTPTPTDTVVPTVDTTDQSGIQANNDQENLGTPTPLSDSSLTSSPPQITPVNKDSDMNKTFFILIGIIFLCGVIGVIVDIWYLRTHSKKKIKTTEKPRDNSIVPIKRDA